MNSLRIGLCQIQVTANVATNYAVAEKAIRACVAQNTTVVVLPEIWNSPYAVSEFANFAENIPDGATTRKMASWAKEYKITLIGGSIPERGEGNKIFNTSLTFNTEGKILAKHRKVHLFDINVPNGISFRESDALTAGDELTTFALSEEVTAGVGICYDIRFPEFSAKMSAKKDVKILFFPAAFNMTTGPMHWELLARARAVDNQLFTILCSPARNENSNYVAFGHSLICDPWGKVTSLDESEGVLVCDLDLSQVSKMRDQIPTLKQKRFDVY